MKEKINQKINQSGSVVIAVIVAVVVTALLVGGGIYVWQKQSAMSANQTVQQQVSELSQELSELKQEQIKQRKVIVEQDTPQKQESSTLSNSNSLNNGNNNVVSSDSIISDWKTYKNTEYGYSIKYPGEWKLKELTGNKTSPDLSKVVKNISLSFFPKKGNEDSFYYLEIGVKNKNEDDVLLSNRTGVGAVHLEERNLLLGKKYNIKVLFGFDPKEPQKVVDIIGKNNMVNDKIIQVQFAYFTDGDYNFDITKTEEYEIAKKILSTFKFEK